MTLRRTLSTVFVLVVTLLWTLQGVARADRIGKPYRGPKELSGAGGGQDDTGPEGVPEGSTEGGGGEGGEGGGGEGGGGEGGGGEGGGSEGGTEGPAPSTSTDSRGGSGKVAVLDGDILWQWWWEHNKDRYIARMTTPGRIQAGSAYYWFGAGAKFPPRDIVPVSDKQRAAEVYPALVKLLSDGDAGVRAEACIALGRLGHVPAGEKEKKEGQPDNLVVRSLKSAYEKSGGARDVRASALLALGMTGDEDACAYLKRNVDAMSGDDKVYAFLAFGLARYLPGIPVLLDSLPKRRDAKDHEVAAIHALGLYGDGPEVLAELGKKNGVELLEKLVNPRAKDARITMQAALTLGRLQKGVKAVGKSLSSKTNGIQWAGLLALSYFASDEKDAAAAAKLLMTNRSGFKSGKGQNKNFAILALGDLAGRLDPNSKTRQKVLKFIKDQALGKKNNYLRACGAIALGAADDKTAADSIAALLTDTTVDDYVIGAACVSLGLLRATEAADTILAKVLNDKRWNDDARGYALMGLALMGNTTLIDEVLKQRNANVRGIDRQVTLAIGVLGDKKNVTALLNTYQGRWNTKQRFKWSNAAYGAGWIGDQSSVNKLVALARDNDVHVRGMAAIALGYVGAADRINPLARCYENASYRNRFGGFTALGYIADIL